MTTATLASNSLKQSIKELTFGVRDLAFVFITVNLLTGFSSSVFSRMLSLKGSEPSLLPSKSPRYPYSADALRERERERVVVVVAIGAFIGSL